MTRIIKKICIFKKGQSDEKIPSLTDKWSLFIMLERYKEEEKYLFKDGWKRQCKKEKANGFAF